MKIVLLSVAYPFRGGIAQFTARLHRQLEVHHEVKTVTFSRQYPEFLFPGKTQFVAKNDAADELKTVRWLDTINPFSYFSTARKIKKESPDVLITRFWMPFFGPSIGTVARLMLSKTKRIAILDNVVPHESRFFDRWLTRYFLRHHDGFVVLSNQVKTDLLQFIPQANVIQLNHPIYDHFGPKTDKTEARIELGIDPTNKTLLFFGFIRDYKGLDILLESLALLDESHQLVIAGEVYGSFDKYQQIINQHGLQKRVYLFNQYIDDQQVAVFFSAADVLMLTYRSATQSGISAIALHYECPSIATAVGGLTEIVQHKKNGLLVQELSPVAVSNSVNEYFNEALQSTFVEALKHEKEAFSWSFFSDQLLDFISSIKRS